MNVYQEQDTGCQWLTLTILATQEAEIRIAVQSQPGQNSSRDPISKIPNTRRAGGVAQGIGTEFKSWYRKKKKKKEQVPQISGYHGKRDWGVTTNGWGLLFQIMKTVCN
jgi:hypothetical protein